MQELPGHLKVPVRGTFGCLSLGPQLCPVGGGRRWVTAGDAKKLLPEPWCSKWLLWEEEEEARRGEPQALLHTGYVGFCHVCSPGFQAPTLQAL